MANECAGADQLRTKAIGAVYYVTFGERGPIKIGYVRSFTVLEQRLRALQTACPYDLTLLATKAGTEKDERALHLRFERHRLRGEWFERHADLMRHIAGVQRRSDCRHHVSRHEAFRPAPAGFAYTKGRKYLVKAGDPLAFRPVQGASNER